MAPCTFTFHSVIDESEPRLIDFETSSLCSSDNGFLVMKEYVSDWHDECVGDYSRCYSLEHHRHILFDFLCAMNMELPPETTHVSVNCMEDKELWLEAQERSQEEGEHEKTPEGWEGIEIKLFNVLLVMGCCLGGIFVISKAIVKPLVAQSSLSLDQQQRQCPEHCRCCNQGWISSQRVHLEVDGTPEEDADLDDFESQIPADFDAVPIVPATLVTDSE